MIVASPHHQQHIQQAIHHAGQRASRLIEMAGGRLFFRRAEPTYSLLPGWLAVISRARNQPREADAYQHLRALLRFFHKIPVLEKRLGRFAAGFTVLLPF